MGDPAAELALLDAYRGGRIHHAWLIGGAEGHRQGDARLSLRPLRAGPPRSASGGAVTGDRSQRGPDHPAFRRVAARAHPNLLRLAAAVGL